MKNRAVYKHFLEALANLPVVKTEDTMLDAVRKAFAELEVEDQKETITEMAEVAKRLGIPYASVGDARNNLEILEDMWEISK